MKPLYFRRAAGPLCATPDIALIGDEAHCQESLNIQADPDGIFVQEKSGDVFRFARVSR
jgi:hypothetical protein